MSATIELSMNLCSYTLIIYTKCGSNIEEKLNQKMEANKENRTASMAALNGKFKEKDKKLDEVRKNKVTTIESDLSF